MKTLLRACVVVLLAIATAEAVSPVCTLHVPPAESGNVTTHNITVPSCGSGELLIIATAFDLVAMVPTWPSGANDSTTQLRFRDTDAGVTFEVRYRFCNGSDAQIDVTTVAGTRSATHVLHCSLAHTSTPPEAAAITQVSPGTLVPDPPSVTPSWGSDTNYYWTITATGQTNTADISTCPTNFTTGCTQTKYASGFITSGQRANTSSSEDPGAFTYTGTAVDYNATTIAVRPAAASSCAGRLTLLGIGC